MRYMHFITPTSLVRIALFFHLIASFGLGSDFAWHMRFWGEDLFKTAHIVMWTGMGLMVSAMLLLKLRGYAIPWHVFALFPLWLFLYITTDNFFDTHFHFNSSNFWTPFRLTWGPIALYHLYWLYKTNIETNEHILMYMRTLLYFVLPLRFIFFVVTPFAPFSVHHDLHGVMSPVVTACIPFITILVYKIQKHPEILLPGIMMISVLRDPYSQFFFHTQNFYRTSSAVFLIFGTVFFLLALKWYTKTSYAFVALITITLIFFAHYMWTGIFDVYGWLLCSAGAVVIGCMYHDIEQYTVDKTRQALQGIL